MQEVETKEVNGYMHADVPLTSTQWLSILQDPNTPKSYIDTLFKFYYEPGHEASCKQVGDDYGVLNRSVNANITHFGEYVQKQFDFNIIDEEGDKRYWFTIMDGKQDGKFFSYKVKEELCTAILSFLYSHLEKEYLRIRKEMAEKGSVDGQSYNELYKWKLIADCQGKNLIDQAQIWKDSNLYDFQRCKSVVIDLISNHKDEFQKVLTNLCDDNQDLSKRLKKFRDDMESIVDTKFAVKANDERIASTILTCHNPKEYTFYKESDVYRGLCNYLGIEPKKDTCSKYPHFMKLIGPLSKLTKGDAELQTLNKSYIGDLTDYDLLLPQDICWILFKQNPEFLDLPPKKGNNNPVNDNAMNTEYDKYIDLLLSNKNVILTGAPGTGKTYLARHIAAAMIGCKPDELDKSGHFGFVQFHPSYDYTDFVEGLRPVQNDDSDVQIGFERKDGVFKEFCEKALKEVNEDKPYIFVIDEINRGEISKIFGELFFSIDPGYRGKEGAVRTQYANLQTTPNAFDAVLNSDTYGHFFVPDNVYIIGTMNDIDRSVESMDFAMRRRFAWEEVTAEESMAMLNSNNNQLENVDVDTINELKNRMKNLNDAIIGKYHKDSNVAKSMRLSTAYQIGGSYFLKLGKYYKNGKTYAFEKLWDNHIKNVVSEYLRGNTNFNEQLSYLESAYNDGTAHENEDVDNTQND